MNRHDMHIIGSHAVHSITEINDEKKVRDQAHNERNAYRSGVAARLAGLSVETLRVWERRYRLSDTDDGW